MVATPKKLPPSKAQVKCTICNLNFCNKAYFLKNHWGKAHRRSKGNPDAHWIYVETRLEKTKWDRIAAPKRLKNPFTFAAGGTSQKKRRLQPKQIKQEKEIENTRVNKSIDPPREKNIGHS